MAPLAPLPEARLSCTEMGCERMPEERTTQMATVESSSEAGPLSPANSNTITIWRMRELRGR